MNDTTKIQLIESYHLGLLSEEERLVFDRLYETDAEFAQQADDFKPIFEGLEMLHLEHFQSQMNLWEAKAQPTEKPETISPNLQLQKGGRWRRSLLQYAAAAVLFIAAPLLYMQYNQPTNGFDNLFQPDASLAMTPALRAGELTAAQKLEKQAIEAYRTKDFAQALPLFHRYETEHKDSVHMIQQMRLFMGVSELALNKCDAAVATLNLYLQNATQALSDNIHEAEWSLCLAYYRKGDMDNCKKILDAILANPKHNHRAKAQQLQSLL